MVRTRSKPNVRLRLATLSRKRLGQQDHRFRDREGLDTIGEPPGRCFEVPRANWTRAVPTTASERSGASRPASAKPPPPPRDPPFESIRFPERADQSEVEREEEPLDRRHRRGRSGRRLRVGCRRGGRGRVGLGGQLPDGLGGGGLMAVDEEGRPDSNRQSDHHHDHMRVACVSVFASAGPLRVPARRRWFGAGAPLVWRRWKWRADGDARRGGGRSTRRVRRGG